MREPSRRTRLRWVMLGVALLLTSVASSLAFAHGAPVSGSHDHEELCVAVGGLACAIGVVALIGGRTRPRPALSTIAFTLSVPRSAPPCGAVAPDWRSPATLCRFLT